MQPESKKHEPKPVDFVISPESLENVKHKERVPKFKIVGHLESVCCSISEPLKGELEVIESSATIKSIELQLVRVETCGCAEGFARDGMLRVRPAGFSHGYGRPAQADAPSPATEIQNLQIGDGDVCHGTKIPIYMIFPRLFTCPTVLAKSFKVEFEVNVVIVFEDNHLVTENFAIQLVRD